MTRYEWVKKNRPDCISKVCVGGVLGCPGHAAFGLMPGYEPAIHSGNCDGNCVACWNENLPETAAVDNVNHPAHYELPGGIECFDVLLATQGVEAVKSFCICNAVKYLFRRNRKNGDEDVKKAAWYVAKYIELAKEAKQ